MRLPGLQGPGIKPYENLRFAGGFFSPGKKQYDADSQIFWPVDKPTQSGQRDFPLFR
jgi:hypothetical protein